MEKDFASHILLGIFGNLFEQHVCNVEILALINKSNCIMHLKKMFKTDVKESKARVIEKSLIKIARKDSLSKLVTSTVLSNLREALP